MLFDQKNMFFLKKNFLQKKTRKKKFIFQKKKLNWKAPWNRAVLAIVLNWGMNLVLRIVTHVVHNYHANVMFVDHPLQKWKRDFVFVAAQNMAQQDRFQRLWWIKLQSIFLRQILQHSPKILKKSKPHTSIYVSVWRICLKKQNYAFNIWKKLEHHRFICN